jgi:hypothetical protein
MEQNKSKKKESSKKLSAFAQKMEMLTVSVFYTGVFVVVLVFLYMVFFYET